jgi:circadian clock protein KaiB
VVGAIPGDGEARLRAALEAQASQTLVLRMYVSGMTLRSAEAIRAIKRICEEHFPGRYDLEVFDLYQSPERAAEADVLAAPTLDKLQPEPVVRMIGNMTDEQRVLRSLGVPVDDEPA